MTLIRAFVVTALMTLHVGAPPAHAAEKLKVVASFSILADLVREVGGERVEVAAIAGPDADLHAFQPTPANARTLAAADLVVLNGLGFEGWADRLVKASGYKGATVVGSKGVAPRSSENAAGGERKGHAHSHGSGQRHAHDRLDPHAWQRPANVKIYVTNIRDALIAADAAGRPQYEAAAAAYLGQLDALDAEIRQTFSALPTERRRVITSHDAFGYFGAAYDIAFLAPQGVTGDSEPTAKDVAALIRQIKKEKIKAVFVENISNPRLIERIAKEAGVTLGGTLYSDALSQPDGPAGSYLAMMRHNTALFAAAMQ